MSTDPYLDPETGVLRNKLFLRTQRELDQAEGAITWARLAQLSAHPERHRHTPDLAGLRRIHHHLFQDLYEWAGQLRTVDLRKRTPDAQPFMPLALLERGAGHAVEQLRQDRHLQGMGRDQFVDRLAHHYEQINYVHPFREGNGRTQRAFWTELAHRAGYHLDWTHVTGETNDRACREAADKNNPDPLREMFARITSHTHTEHPDLTATLRLAAAKTPPLTAREPDPERTPTAPAERAPEVDL